MIAIVAPVKRRVGLRTLYFFAAVLFVSTPAFLYSQTKIHVASPARIVGQSTPLQGTQSQQREFLEQRCVDCHNDDDRRGGFSTSQLNLAHPEQSREIAEKIIQKLRLGMMPPFPKPRPATTEWAPLVNWLEASVDQDAAHRPYVGSVGLHRLNRVEYANSVHALLNLDVDVTSLLPADDLSHGFNNMADSLTISPSLLKAYVDAAGKISRQAVGDLTVASTESIYRIPRVISQTRQIDGTPYGSRGGVAVTHTFPVDGEYVFKLAFYTHQQGYLFGQNQGKGQQIELAVNGERVALFDIDPKWKVGQDLKTPPIPVKAGPQVISAAFIRKFDGPIQDEVQPYVQSLIDVNVANLPGLTTLPHLYGLTIAGPTKVSTISDTPSRERIFICHPTQPAQQDACARTIVTRLVRRAYRKPSSRENVDQALQFYRGQRTAGHSFDEGVRASLQSVLANPQFLFRFERERRHQQDGRAQRLTDLELASRLAYFLWSAPPDDRLIRVASRHQLHRHAVLNRQVRRMLADRRSSALANNFAVQWLNLNNLKDVLPDPYLYPNFDSNLAHSMLRETELFFESIVRENHSVLDLLDAKYTFVDEALARHYGIPNVLGNRFRRVEIQDERRRGLLGQASILTLTSTANRTSPVTRGKWILQVLLGAPPPPPPPNIPTLVEAGDDATPRTVRQRLEEHRKNPSCASCHNRIDAQGFALENFDPTGAWRRLDTSKPIDSTATMFDGAKLDGPVALRHALLQHSDVFLRTFTRNLLTYGVGRVPDYRDEPLVRSVVKQSQIHDYRFSDLVLGIVESSAFQKRAEGVAPERRETQPRVPPTHVTAVSAGVPHAGKVAEHAASF
jgi:mono/diheme cytochrome c family protein